MATNSSALWRANRTHLISGQKTRLAWCEVVGERAVRVWHRAACEEDSRSVDWLCGKPPWAAPAQGPGNMRARAQARLFAAKLGGALPLLLAATRGLSFTPQRAHLPHWDA
jgi:hypothetical protein